MRERERERERERKGEERERERDRESKAGRRGHLSFFWSFCNVPQFFGISVIF